MSIVRVLVHRDGLQLFRRELDVFSLFGFVALMMSDCSTSSPSLHPPCGNGRGCPCSCWLVEAIFTALAFRWFPAEAAFPATIRADSLSSTRRGAMQDAIDHWEGTSVSRKRRSVAPLKKWGRRMRRSAKNSG